MAYLASTAYISIRDNIEEEFKEPKTYKEAIESQEKDL
jgi:hypothetical protein